MKKKEKVDERLITKSMLKTRGWTDSLIKMFYAVPAKKVANLHYRQASDICLYSLESVEKIESTEEFKLKLEISLIRSKKSKEVAQKKLDMNISLIENIELPEIPLYPKNKLYKKACEHYNDLWGSRGNYDKNARVTDSEEFLKRITVNFLRHELSPYEDLLLEQYGKIGAGITRLICKEKILEAIQLVYPWLKEECEKQNPFENASEPNDTDIDRYSLDRINLENDPLN